MAESSALNLIKRIGTAVILIPVVLVLILKAPVPVLAIVAGIIALLTVHELLKLSEGYTIRPFWKPTYVYFAIYFVLLAGNPGIEKPLVASAIFIYGTAFAAALAPFVFMTLAMRRESLPHAWPAAMTSAFAFVYIALPLGLLVQLREQWEGAYLIFCLLLIVWAGDIFAYFVGRSVGRHRMSPRISPKKTWEGAVASVIASLIVGVLVFGHAQAISQFFLNLDLIDRRDGIFTPNVPPLWLAVVINIAAQLGDLVESLIKRGADVKDSGALLPGHGGMLDRIDALLFAAPVMWFYAACRVMQ